MTSDIHDIVWDPFAGLFTTAVASFELDRACYCAEISRDVYDYGISRIEERLQNGLQCSF